MANTTQSNETVLSESASLYGADGYLQQSGVRVSILRAESTSDDDVILVGATSHHRADILEEGDTLTSLAAGWYIKL